MVGRLEKYIIALSNGMLSRVILETLSLQSFYPLLQYYTYMHHTGVQLESTVPYYNILLLLFGEQHQ